MPAKGKGRCRFIDDDVDVSDAVDDDGEEGEEGGPRRGRKRRKQARIASSDEEEGDDVPTKEDLEFVVDDHVSEAEEEEEKVRISRKERRVGRDEMNLMLENVGLRTRRYKDEKKKVKTSVWKDDDDEDSVHTSDQGFVVDDDEEEVEEGEDDDGEEVDSAKDEDGETIATSSEVGSEDMSDPFVLDASNILSEALRFRRETAFESTSLSEVLDANA
jgi:transcription elongation factor SPT6